MVPEVRVLGKRMFSSTGIGWYLSFRNQVLVCARSEAPGSVGKVQRSEFSAKGSRVARSVGKVLEYRDPLVLEYLDPLVSKVQRSGTRGARSEMRGSVGRVPKVRVLGKRRFSSTGIGWFLRFRDWVLVGARSEAPGSVGKVQRSGFSASAGSRVPGSVGKVLEYRDLLARGLRRQDRLVGFKDPGSWQAHVLEYLDRLGSKGRGARMRRFSVGRKDSKCRVDERTFGVPDRGSMSDYEPTAGPSLQDRFPKPEL
ncbi:hypothetical protein R1sor_009268 [Riccia sorocarpa]|uniref:Uncharacterized protein n=1 Tax=Riccia sorocarpa TaxID=122646 RepID=A0ABD3HUL3_9MARC